MAGAQNRGIAEYITVIFTILLVMVSVSIGLGFWTSQIATSQKEVAISSGRADIFNFERIITAKLRGNSSGIYIPTMTDGRIVLNATAAVLTISDGPTVLNRTNIDLFFTNYEWGSPVFPSVNGTGLNLGGFLVGLGNVSDSLEESVNIVESGQGPHYIVLLYFSPTIVPSFTSGPNGNVDHFWVYLVRYGDTVPVFAAGGNNVVISVGTKEVHTEEWCPSCAESLPNCGGPTCTIDISFSIDGVTGYDWTQSYITTSEHLVLHITHITVQRR